MNWRTSTLAVIMLSLGAFVASTIGRTMVAKPGEPSGTEVAGNVHIRYRPVSRPTAKVRQTVFNIRASLSPAALHTADEGILNVEVATASWDSLKGEILISVDGNGFNISPESLTLFPRSGEKRSFVVSPKNAGKKKLKVYAVYQPSSQTNESGLRKKLPPSSRYPEKEIVLDVTVSEPREFVGLGVSTLRVIQGVAASIGLPAIILFFLPRYLDRRKEEAREKPRIITPN